MDCGIIQGVRGIRDTEETRTLLEGLCAKARDLHELGARLEYARFGTVSHDLGGQRRSDTRDISKEIGAGCIEVDSYAVDAHLNGSVKLLFQEALVDIVLILAHAQRFRVDLDELGKGIHETAADGDSPAHGDVLVRKLLASDFRSGIDRGSVLADSPHLAAFRQVYLLHELLRLPAGRTVTDGHGLDAILLYHGGHRHDGLDLLVLGRMREYDLMMQ